MRALGPTLEEVIARALDPWAFGEVGKGTNPDTMARARSIATRNAKRVLGALPAAGLKLLGREPTEAMVVVYAGTDAPRVLAHLGDEAVGTWQAMWDAAEPSLPTGGTTGVTDE